MFAMQRQSSLFVVYNQNHAAELMTEKEKQEEVRKEVSIK
jgi:hypothetical protein